MLGSLFKNCLDFLVPKSLVSNIGGERGWWGCCRPSLTVMGEAETSGQWSRWLVGDEIKVGVLSIYVRSAWLSGLVRHRVCDSLKGLRTKFGRRIWPIQESETATQTWLICQSDWGSFPSVVIFQLFWKEQKARFLVELPSFHFRKGEKLRPAF